MDRVPLPTLNVPPAGSEAPARSGVLTHYPAPPPETAAAADVGTVERTLADWFGRPVVLLGSGRAGIHLFMTAMGLGRYRDQVAVPPYLSTCVMDTLARHAFPVRPGGEAGLTLLYHQYGLPQRKRPDGPILEDICHRFFADARTGARDWTGEAAVFSLPKFFGIAGMGGGLVVPDAKTADRIRALRDAAEDELPGVRAWMRTVISATYRGPGASALAPLLESAYALLIRYPRPDGADLAGFPADRDGIAAIGEKRSRVVKRLAEILGPGTAPVGVTTALEGGLPFAFPFFGGGDPEWLANRSMALAEAGIHAGVYNLDVRMDMGRPQYRPCVLLPCHQNVGDGHIEAMARILRP